MNLKERTKWAIYDVLKRDQLTVNQLAERMGCSESLINNYKKLRNTPNSDFTSKLCTEFGLNPEWIMSGRGERYVIADSATPSDDLTVELPVSDGQIKESEADSSSEFGSINSPLLKRIIARVERNLEIKKISLEPEKKAELISLLYEYFAGTGKDVEAETVERYLRLVA